MRGGLHVALAHSDRAKELVCSCPGLGVRDAIHAAVMLNNDLQHITSFDQGLDRLPQVNRLALTLKTALPAKELLIRTESGAEGGIPPVFP